MERLMKMKNCFYVLDGHNVRATDDLMEVARFWESPDRQVAYTHEEYYEVSTVFLAIPQGHFRPGPPMLFETMVFANDAYKALVPERESMDQFTLRYPSWDDAQTGHDALLKRLRKHIELAKSGGFEATEDGNEKQMTT
jgi:hypothetical protein